MLINFLINTSGSRYFFLKAVIEYIINNVSYSPNFYYGWKHIQREVSDSRKDIPPLTLLPSLENINSGRNIINDDIDDITLKFILFDAT